LIKLLIELLVQPAAEDAAPRLSYAYMRLRWCRAALADLLRRWAVYVVVGIVVLGGAANGALTAMAALAAWSVFPLLRATTQSLGILSATALLHSLAGALVIWGLRPVLWPRAWSDAEAALPIQPRDLIRSDIVVTGFALTPLLCTYAAGALVWRAQSPPWLQGEWLAGWAALALSAGLSLLWGVLIIRRLRHRPRSLARPSTRGSTAEVRRLSVHAALIVTPLLRGPAGRSASVLVLGTAVLLGIEGALWRWPALAAWWLAAFAASSLIASTRLNALLTDELAPLHQHAFCLPVALTSLLRARRAVALLPQVIAQLGLMLVLATIGHGLRTAVFTAYMLTLFTGSLAQVVATTRVEGHHTTDPAHRVSYWLFTLVLGVVLATEVFP
jgi:hypothetical protein